MQANDERLTSFFKTPSGGKAISPKLRLALCVRSDFPLTLTYLVFTDGFLLKSRTVGVLYSVCHARHALQMRQQEAAPERLRCVLAGVTEGT